MFKKKRLVALLGCIVVMIGMVLLVNNRNNIFKENALIVEKIVTYLGEKNEKTIDFSSFTPFAWDEGIIVEDNDIGGEVLASRIGMKSDDDFDLPSEETDNVGRIIFFLDGKVIRYFSFSRNKLDFFPLGLRFTPDNSLFQRTFISREYHRLEHVPAE
jgi:hypothetical protein